VKPGELDRNLQRLAEIARQMDTLAEQAVSALHDARTALSGGGQAETTGSREQEMARESSTAEAREPTSARQRPQVEVVVK